nr:hypothetical protein [Tanacetum cinerariifolium]
SEVESDEDVLRIDVGVQDEGQAGPNPGEQDEGHAGPNPDNEKTNEETKAESMVSVTIQQDTSSIPFMKTPRIDLTSRQDSPNVSKAVDEIVTDAVDWAIQAPLWNRFRDLPEADMKEILHQRMWETNSYKTYEDHMMLYKALEKSMNHDHTDELLKDLAEAHKKKKKRRDSPKMPRVSPPPPPPLADLEYLRYSSKGSRPALSISKMKAAYYPDVGLEQMVPDQMWIKEEYKYGIAAMYGISYLWFQRQRFYIDRHTSEGDRRAVKTQMGILSVVRIKVFSMYGYDYMKKIVLCRANLNEHIIAEQDFKYLYPSDIKDL